MKFSLKSAKVVLSMIFLCVLVTVFSATVMAAPVLDLSSSTYEQGDTFTLTYTGVASGTDWFGIYETGVIPGDEPSLWWANTAYYGVPDDVCDFSSGFDIDGADVSLAELNLAPGNYTIYLCLDNGYEVATQVDFTVVDPNAVTPTTAPSPDTGERSVATAALIIAILSAGAILFARKRCVA